HLHVMKICFPSIAAVTSFPPSGATLDLLMAPHCCVGQCNIKSFELLGNKCCSKCAITFHIVDVNASNNSGCLYLQLGSCLVRHRNVQLPTRSINQSLVNMRV